MATQQVSQQQQYNLCFGGESSADEMRAEQALNVSLQQSEQQSRPTDTRTDEDEPEDDDGDSSSTSSMEKPPVPYYPPMKKGEFNHSFTKNYLLDHNLESLEESISSIDTTRTSNLRTDGLMDLCDLAALMMPPSVTRPRPMVRKSQGNMAA